MTILAAEAVSKIYRMADAARPWRRTRLHALVDVSIDIGEGECFGLVGESGSGKSTLARILAGAIAPSAGLLRLFGEQMDLRQSAHLRRLRATVQIMPQDSTGTLNPRMSVLNAIAFGPAARGRSAREARSLAAQALERVGLSASEFGGRLPNELSGGQRQRVNLARSLVLEPRLLILDEPVSALDKSVQAQVLNLLAELRRDLAFSMMLISHDLEVVRYLCDRVAVMEKGRIVERGATEAVFDRPTHGYTQTLVDAVPRFVEASAEPEPPPPGAHTLVEAAQLRVEFRGKAGVTHAVRGVSFQVQRGEILAIVGESGCGKSVMLRALVGLLPPEARVSGKVTLTSVASSEAGPEALRRVRGGVAGMVFQDPLGSLDPLAPIGRQIEDVFAFHGHRPPEGPRAAALALLGRAQLADAAARYDALAHQFSGGQRQRIGIALALAANPSIILADEPTTALDVSVQARILKLLVGLCREQGIAMVFVTHDMAVAQEVGDRLAVMYAGRIVEQGPVSAVFRAPKHPYTEALLKSYRAVRAGASPLPTLTGAPPRLSAEPTGCAFAPRCPVAMEACWSRPPEQRRAGRVAYECKREEALAGVLSSE